MYSVADCKQQTSGFTLVEVLVAIVILTTVITVPITIIAQHLTINAQSEQRVRAMFLTQEIIEQVRYTRDVDVLHDNIWFTHLSSSDNITNDYRGCLVSESDWLNNPETAPFCRVLCFEGTENNTGDCGGSFNGFVSGVMTTSLTPDTINPDTCDGLAPKADGELTATLTIVVPSLTNRAWYAAIRPCVSWADRNGKVHQVELVETVFEWITGE